MVKRRPTLIPASWQFLMPSKAALKAPLTPLKRSLISSIPSRLMPTYERPMSLRTRAICCVIKVPFVDITARMPFSTAYAASSGRSFRIVGSPPESNSTGTLNWERSSIRLLPSSVVSSLLKDWSFA